jgi:Domain of unknown function (DUF4189)
MAMTRWCLLALLLGFGLAGDVQAGCREVCEPQTDCEGLWGEERWRCVAGRSFETRSCRTVCTDAHGAIAYSRQTGSWGHSYDWDSPARAGRAALGACARHASDCRVMVSFVNQCGALAAPDQGEARHGLGGTRKEAEDRSVAACRASGGATCKLITGVCSTN